MTCVEAAVYAERYKRSEATIWRWAKRGCDFKNPESVKAFLIEAERKKTNIQRYRERHGDRPDQVRSNVAETGRRCPPDIVDPPGNGELPPPGKRGAGAALARLEKEEERGHARLQAALASGNPVAIDAAQAYWLRVAETLRRLDRELEISRRAEEVQIPLRQAEAAVLAVADWMRISVAVFLSSEAGSLMGIRDRAEFRSYFWSRFVGILHLTVKNSLKTQSSIPSWAAERVKESWNVSENLE